MIDLRTKRDEFRRALHDPFQVAKLLQIPPISPSSNQHPSTSVVHISKSSEKCEYEGIDWSGVLSNWLDACQAADAVRFESLSFDCGICRNDSIVDALTIPDHVDLFTISALFLLST